MPVTPTGLKGRLRAMLVAVLVLEGAVTVGLLLAGLACLVTLLGLWGWLRRLALGAAALATVAAVGWGLYRLARRFVRRRFQFSLRTLLIGTAVLSLILGTVGVRLIELDKRRRTTSQLVSLGATVVYDYQEARLEESKLPWTSRLRSVLGCDPFAPVVDVSLRADSALAEGLPLLDQFPELDSMTLSGAGVTDAGVLHLAQTGVFPRLKWLTLIETLVTDAGLASLRARPGLTDLCISGGQVTDAGLAHLEEMATLKRLVLRDLAVSDAGMVHLEKMSQLETLALARIPLTDAGLAHLRHLKSLRELRLGGTRVTDAGLVHLEDSKSLRTLTLMGTQITDAALVHLEGLTGLKTIHLIQTQVTDEGVERLRRAIPGVEILR